MDHKKDKEKKRIKKGQREQNKNQKYQSDGNSCKKYI